MEVHEKLAEKNRRLKRLRQRLERQEEEISRLRAGLAQARSGTYPEKPAPTTPGEGRGGLQAENVVWIFGTGRSGSTWLMRMMGELEQHSHWSEPFLGELFGRFYNEARKDQLPSRNFILGEPFRKNWLRSIRGFVLEGARVRYPKLTSQHYLVIKEPTQGAFLLAEALPESRVIFLVRDLRDVVASHLDAARKESWLHQVVGNPGQGQVGEAVAIIELLDEGQPDLFVKRATENLMRNMMGAKRAYETHRGPKALVRYEDLCSNTLGTMRRLYRELGLYVGEEQLTRAVEKHSWENIPAEQKGEGKFYRKATPGSWQRDLTPRQIEIVEKVAAPILEEFYA